MENQLVWYKNGQLWEVKILKWKIEWKIYVIRQTREFSF